jgi:hypothetical protein
MTSRFRCGFDESAWRNRFFKPPSAKYFQEPIQESLDDALESDPYGDGTSWRGFSVLRTCYHGKDLYELNLSCEASADFNGDEQYKVTSYVFVAELGRTAEDGTNIQIATMQADLDWTSWQNQAIAMRHLLMQIQTAFFSDSQYLSVQESQTMTTDNELLPGKSGKQTGSL